MTAIPKTHEAALKLASEKLAENKARTEKARTAAVAKVNAEKEHARQEAAMIAARESMLNTLRLSYYVIRDFEDYQAAYNSRVPNEDGILPFVNPDDYKREPPTEEEWASLTTEQKLAQGSITTFNL